MEGNPRVDSMKWVAVVVLTERSSPIVYAGGVWREVEWRGTAGGTLMPGSLWELEVAVGFEWTVLR